MTTFVYYPLNHNPRLSALTDAGELSIPFNCGKELDSASLTILEQLFAFKEDKVTLQNAYLNIVYALGENNDS